MISVLIVDDDPAILELIRIFLERSGEMQIETSRSATEAINILKSKNFDVIVSDYEMPQIDGLVFLKILRAEGETVPFIMFTGKGREWVAMEALNNGADFYLTKNDDAKERFAELEKMIYQAVQRRQVEKSLSRFNEESVDLIRILPDATFVIDTSGTVISWNKAMETLTGVKAGDILDKGQYEYSFVLYGDRRPILIDYVVKNDDILLYKQYPNVQREGDSYATEVKRARLKGKEAFLWVKATRIFDRDGTLLGAIESVHDVTDIRKFTVQRDTESTEKSPGLLDRLLGKPPEKTWYQKGMDLYFQQGRYEEAIQCFDRAIEVEKNPAEAWKGKGICLKELGRYEEALQCFDQVVFLSPGDPEGHYSRGETLEKIGKSSGEYRFIEMAIQSFERVIELKPDDWKAWNYSGLCYKELGKSAEARRRFERAEILLHKGRGFSVAEKPHNVSTSRNKPESGRK